MQRPDCPLDLKYTVLHLPVSHVLLLVLNRPYLRNCMTREAQYELERVFVWFDKTPDLRCAIITGAGTSFSAGGDLHEWHRLNQLPFGTFDLIPRRGFAGLTRRFGKKPVIAAVNGAALGGGFEMLMGVDLIIASGNATFGLPEVKRGVLAVAGCLPRLMKNVGRHRAMQFALLGEPITAEHAHQWGLVNEIVAESSGTEEILKRPVVLKAVEYARKIATNSPDSIILSRTGVLFGHELGSAETASWLLRDIFDQGMDENPNLREGVMAFVHKRMPVWKPSKL
ncbi:ClpP/crotonase-like domain-containing protein [Aspergillus floccosus]